MEDLLYKAAKKYEKLLNTVYHIVLGRKGKQYDLLIKFRQDDFFHLAGLQHLSDLIFSSKNSERVYKDILAEKVTYDDIEKSDHFIEYNIAERLKGIFIIEQILDSNKMIFLINGSEYIRYSRIKADYLCEYLYDDITIYLFMVNRNREMDINDVGCCSLFYKHKVDYRKGTSEAKVLLIEKTKNVNCSDAKTEILFVHHKYKCK